MLVSTLMLRGITAELQRRAIDPQVALEAAGISSTTMADLRARVPLDRADKLTKKALQLTGDPALGLAIGANAPENMLQVVGHLIVSCRTLREAIQSFFRHSSFLIEGAKWDLVETGDRAYFTYERSVLLGDTSQLAAEVVLLVTKRIGQRFSRDQSTCHEVWFAHAAPPYAAKYQQAFGCPVRFGQTRNALVFPRVWLDTPQLHADETMVTALHDMAARLLTDNSNTALSERIRVLLRYESDLGHVDVDQLARRLGLSRRALRGRLAAEGVSLTTLLDEVRCEVACEELRLPNSCIKSTAARLGFSERSAFHRAFKRWTGKTPLEYSRSA